jgi:hypothetical protein
MNSIAGKWFRDRQNVAENWREVHQDCADDGSVEGAIAKAFRTKSLE